MHNRALNPLVGASRSRMQQPLRVTFKELALIALSLQHTDK
jgi:hypothetical protein